MTKRKITFRKVYITYLLLLVVLVAAALLYVNKLLQQYEAFQPETYMKGVMAELSSNAKDGTFWSAYSMPEVNAGEFEKHFDVQEKYLALYQEEQLEFKQKSGAHEEDELFYIVKNKDTELAEIKLKAKGPAVTKLAVLSFREWQIEYVKPLFETKEYTISVPADFTVYVNDIELPRTDDASSKQEEQNYTIGGVYFVPEFLITNQEGETVKHTIDKQNQVIAEFYDYSLTLPSTLKVEVNGEVCQGEALEGNRVLYDIRVLSKPNILISDNFGNVVTYEGGDKLPLTYMTILADSRYHIKVAGAEVPDTAICSEENHEYAPLKNLVQDLPQILTYDITVLEDNAEVSITNEEGEMVDFEPGQLTYDFTAQIKSYESVPEAVGAEVDVLDTAQKWSLFMSNDLPFSQMKQYLIADSYQYKVAVEYATGVDIRFTSSHTLKDPAFTENTVTNFQWITEDCFSVDISFVKHMVLRTGKKVDDPMNDRFYFVKYDDTEDGLDNPQWKIASMKEIVDNER